MTELQIENLGIDYGARRIVDALSLRVAAGEVLVVAGANGSGKSSLVRSICGLQRPTRGSVRLAHAGAMYAPAAARHLIGWVAPDVQLYRELTGDENLAFFARVRGLALSAAGRSTLLDEVGLAGRGDELLRNYSSGMAQRLRYACALLHAPPLLLLDEPTVNFDQHGAALFVRVVAQQRARGITVIATNDARELAHADLLIRLDAVEAR